MTSTAPPPHHDESTDHDGLSRFIADRKRLVLSIVFGLLLAAGVILLIGRASGFAKLVDRLREASAGWLVAAVGVQAASIGGYVLAFRETVVNGGRRPGFGATTHIVLASLGATRLLAAAGAGGLAVNYWALRRFGIEAREAVIRVLTLNTLLYAIFGVGGLAAAIVTLTLGEAPASLAIPWIAIVGTALLAARYVAAPARVERLSRDVAPGAGNRLWTTIRRGFAAAVASVGRVQAILAAPRRHWWTIGGAAAYWIGDIACLGLGLAAFGVHVTPGVLVLGYLTGYVANVLPLPTGGVGGVDAAMTFSLNLLGVPLEEALAGVIAYRFVGFWLPTIPAAWALIGLPRLGRSLEAAAPRASLA